MIKESYQKLIQYIMRLESKIAFYPTVVGLVGLFFSVFMYYLEELNVSKYLLDHAPWLVINNVETARTILATFVGGLISILVFSFSMVMILLNQASSNYSPRVLPGLISNRRHQIILGIYNACLLYCIFTLIAIEPTGDKYQLPGFSVLLAIFFMTLCLGAFIYFIHSISQGIQINNIMASIFKKAKNRLEIVLDYEQGKTADFPNTTDWSLVSSKTNGYLEDIVSEALLKILEQHEAKAEVLIYKGQYVREGTPILKVDAVLNDDLGQALLNTFHFSRSELIENNYVLAFKQITEIAVKAMSPGINDPGTAINAIDYLTDLLIMRIKKSDTSYYYNDADEAVICFRTITFQAILRNVMMALRTYCKSDALVVRTLIEMLHELLWTSAAIDSYKEAVVEELDSLLADAQFAIQNRNDLQILESRVQEIKSNFNNNKASLN